MWHRFTKTLRTVVLLALKNAKVQNRSIAEPDDFLAAIAQLPGCSAAKVLHRLNIANAVQSAAVAEAVNAISSPSLRLIEQACEESANLFDRHVGTDHLLLALARTRSATDARLARVGVDEVGREVRNMRTAGFGPDAAVPFTQTAAPENPPQFTVLDPALIGDPYPLYDRIRPIAPVYRDPLAPMWVVTGYPEAAQAFREPRLRNEPRSNPTSTSPAEIALPVGPVRDDLCVISNVLSRMLVFSEPPLHGAIRNQLGQMLSPRGVGASRDRVQAIADQLLDEVASRGRMDLIDDYACPLPLLVVMQMMGLGREDMPKLKKWSDIFGALIAFTTTIRDDLISRRALIEMRQYFDRAFADLRQAPDASLLGRLIAPHDDSPPMDFDGLFANCVFLLAAGHVTTTSVLGSGVRTLLSHPDQLSQLRSDPSLMPGAVEELLRLHSPVQWTRRRAVAELRLGDQPIAAGDVVLISIGAANRDPRQFPDPHRLDITRADANKHLAFSGGGHFCLGAALARMELQIGLNTLFRRFANLCIPQGFEVHWNPGLTLHAFDHLPLTFGVR